MATQVWGPLAAIRLLMLLWLQQSAIANIEGDKFFNKWGDCNQPSVNQLSGTDYTLHDISPTAVMFRANSCQMSFKAAKGFGVCITFDDFRVTECRVELRIYQSSSNDETPWQSLSCQTHRPSRMCTTSQEVTFDLVKDKSFNAWTGYDFTIKVEQISNQTIGDRITGGGVLAASIGVFVGIVVGVVVLIATLAFTLIYCCCMRNKSRDDVEKMNADQPRDAGVEPSAPPLNDMEESNERDRLYPHLEAPPPYVPPPPYEERVAVNTELLPPHSTEMKQIL